MARDKHKSKSNKEINAVERSVVKYPMGNPNFEINDIPNPNMSRYTNQRRNRLQNQSGKAL